MSDLTLIIIRIGFLAVLWLFIFIVLYSLRSDLFGPRLTPLQRVAVQSQRTREEAAAASAAAPVGASDAPTTVTQRPSASSASAAPAASASRAGRIVITTGPRAGIELDLPETGLTIGRSSGSGLQIKDDYTSNAHAKVVRWRDSWMVQDLDSTNGTFVDGRRITEATPLRVGSSVRIGTTTFELRR